jgi:plasmid stability protein
MGVLTIRNVPDAIHLALKARAAQHGRSTEAEVRAIIAMAVNPDGRARMGDLLWETGRQIDLHDEDVDAIFGHRDRTPAQPIALE